MNRVALTALLLVLAACGTEPAPAGSPGSGRDPVVTRGVTLPPEPDAASFSSGHPPVFHVLAGGGEQLEVPAWTFCMPGLCADGGPGDHPPRVGSPEAVEFGFDLSGWAFEDVTFRERGSDCSRHITVAAERTGPRTFRISPAGLAGDWDVDIFGRGPDGDAVTTIRWQTPVDGTLPTAASGTASVLAQHDGTLDSYGVEVAVADLATHPQRASATVTVTSAAGASTTIRTRPQLDCYSAGSISFGASAAAGRAALGLGDGPFEYEVDLVVDGTPYTGRATWPDDEIEDYAPNVALVWTPPLPTYAGQDRDASRPGR
jgi:hypothetical protein